MIPAPPDRPSAPPSPPEPGARRDALDYARSMLAELSAIARRERLDMLAYLIEMAYVEAADVLARDAAAAARPGRHKSGGGAKPPRPR